MPEALTTEQETLLEQGLALPLMEEFYTVQGEGFHTGKAAWFIRIGGCDVGCHWCDVKESWDPDLHPLTKVDTIVEHACDNPSGSVVVTGGEPTLYSLRYLCEQLGKKNLKTFLETSGAYPLTGEWHWICLSPKKTAPPLEEYYAKANELKIIVHNQDDLKWAEEHAARVNTECLLYLQPEWSKSEEVMPLIVDHVQQNPKWQVSLQSHKYMRIP